MLAFAKSIQERPDAHLISKFKAGLFKITFEDVLGLARCINDLLFDGAFHIKDGSKMDQPYRSKCPARTIFIRYGIAPAYPKKGSVTGLYWSKDTNSGLVSVKRGLSPKNTLATLVHEMVHAHVHLVQGLPDEDHGPEFMAWAEKCAAIGVPLTEKETPESWGIKKISPHFLVYHMDAGYPIALGITRNAVTAQAWAGWLAHHKKSVFVSIVSSIEERVSRLVGYPRAAARINLRAVENVGKDAKQINKRVFFYVTPEEDNTVKSEAWVLSNGYTPGQQVFLVDAAIALEALDGTHSVSSALQHVTTHPLTIDLLTETWTGGIVA